MSERNQRYRRISESELGALIQGQGPPEASLCGNLFHHVKEAMRGPAMPELAGSGNWAYRLRVRYRTCGDDRRFGCRIRPLGTERGPVWIS